MAAGEDRVGDNTDGFKIRKWWLFGGLGKNKGKKKKEECLLVLSFDGKPILNLATIWNIFKL